MIAASLAKIKAEVHALIAEAADAQPVCPYALLTILHKLDAQADMLAKGLDG